MCFYVLKTSKIKRATPSGGLSSIINSYITKKEKPLLAKFDYVNHVENISWMNKVSVKHLCLTNVDK